MGHRSLVNVRTPADGLALGLTVVVIVAAFGTLLALQGWRSRVPGTEVIYYMDGARGLLSDGRFPDRGVLTGLGSYAPPGLAWSVLPAMILFSDPRVFDALGNTVLHLGTLLGIFLLARACLGAQCAMLAVLLYGVSERGLIFAGSFEPRGHPFFYVWMAYCTCWWVALKDARYLAAAVATWLVGMYAFMEIAPAVFMLPAVCALRQSAHAVSPRGLA